MELVEIDHIHRRAEFQIIIDPAHGQRLRQHRRPPAMDYGFGAEPVQAVPDRRQGEPKAIHIYSKLGFNVEGELIDEFFVNGEYRTVLRIASSSRNIWRSSKRPMISRW